VKGAAERLPLDRLEHEVGRALNVLEAVMPAMFGWLREAKQLRLGSKRARRSGRGEHRRKGT